MAMTPRPMSVYLIIDASTIDAHVSRPALGCIHIAMGGVAFPSASWRDFLVVVLGWWSRAAYRLIAEGSKREIVNFMDGPHSVEIEKEVNGILRFRALTGDGRRKVFAEADEDATSFARDLLRQAEAVLIVCKDKGWTSPDLDELQDSVGALERIFAMH